MNIKQHQFAFTIIAVIVTFNSCALESLIQLQQATERIAQQAARFVYTPGDSQKLLAMEPTTTVYVRDDIFSKALSSASSPQLRNAITELIKAHELFTSKDFSFCSCHSIPLRFDAILRILDSVQKNYKPQDHIVYTSISSGDLLQEALTLHMLFYLGYTNCTLNAIDILYFEPASLGSDLEKQYQELKNKYPGVAADTLYEVYIKTQVRFAVLQEYFPQLILHTYQRTYSYLTQFEQLKQKKKEEYITILTMIDPGKIGSELSGFYRPEAVIEEDAHGFYHMQNTLLERLLSTSYPARNNVMLFDNMLSDQQKQQIQKGMLHMSPKDQFASFAYLPFTNAFPPYLISHNPEQTQNFINARTLLLKNYSQKKVTTPGMVLTEITFAPHSTSFTTNSYVAFFDIASTMMARNGLVCYTNARPSDAPARILFFENHGDHFLQELKERYQESMNTLVSNLDAAYKNYLVDLH